MDVSDSHTRFKILQTVYRGGKERKSDTYRFIPEMLGYTYAEMNYQLRYMKTKNLIAYTPRMLMRNYTITILPAGKEIVEQFETAFFSDAQDRDEKMKDALARLK